MIVVVDGVADVEDCTGLVFEMFDKIVDVVVAVDDVGVANVVVGGVGGVFILLFVFSWLCIVVSVVIFWQCLGICKICSISFDSYSKCLL